MSRASRLRGNRFVVTLALAACLACVALICTAPTLLAVGGGRRSTPGSGLAVVPLCAWARQGRAGLWWNVYVPPSASLARAYGYNAVCVTVPRVPGLPDRGSPSFDYTP